MSTPTTGAPVWIELLTTDMSKASAFYGALFGWQFQDSGPEFGHYNIIQLDNLVVGGAMQIDPERMAGATDSFAVYLSTDDVEATTAKVTAAGGQVLVPPMQVGDQGSMAFYLDDTGAAIGAWQSAGRVGIEAARTPGASAWYELMTYDYDKAVSFYQNAFGWDAHPMPGGFKYATLGGGESAKAGICDASQFSQGGQSFWRVYFESTDTDQAIQTVKELGGELLDGPQDSEYGRIATVKDDQGAMFQIMG